jgi:hypothetical protein
MEVGQGPNWGRSTKEKNNLKYYTLSWTGGLYAPVTQRATVAEA